MAEKGIVEPEKQKQQKKKKNVIKKETMPMDVITEMVSQEDIDNVFREING